MIEQTELDERLNGRKIQIHTFLVLQDHQVACSPFSKKWLIKKLKEKSVLKITGISKSDNMTFDEYMLKIPGYMRSGFNKSLAREMWDYKQQKTDELIAESVAYCPECQNIMKFEFDGHDTLVMCFCCGFDAIYCSGNRVPKYWQQIEKHFLNNKG